MSGGWKQRHWKYGEGAETLKVETLKVGTLKTLNVRTLKTLKVMIRCPISTKRGRDRIFNWIDNPQLDALLEAGSARTISTTPTDNTKPHMKPKRKSEPAHRKLSKHQRPNCKHNQWAKEAAPQATCFKYRSHHANNSDWPPAKTTRQIAQQIASSEGWR